MCGVERSPTKISPAINSVRQFVGSRFSPSAANNEIDPLYISSIDCSYATVSTEAPYGFIRPRLEAQSLSERPTRPSHKFPGAPLGHLCAVEQTARGLSRYNSIDGTFRRRGTDIIRAGARLLDTVCAAEESSVTINGPTIEDKEPTVQPSVNDGPAHEKVARGGVHPEDRRVQQEDQQVQQSQAPHPPGQRSTPGRRPLFRTDES